MRQIKVLFERFNLVTWILLLVLFVGCHKDSQIANLPPLDPSTSTTNKHKRGAHSQDSNAQSVTPSAINNQPAADVKPATAISQTNVQNAVVTSTSNNEVNVNTLTATVNGVQTSALSFRISGYISSVLVKNGQYVKKGQIIAKLDNSIALQNLNLSKFALEQAETSEHFAELTLKRTQTLNQRQATTQIALEQAELAFQNSQIAVKQAEANWKLAQINYDETNLIAPFDGYLFGLASWVGTYVSSTTIIATLTSINDLQIQIPVPQTVSNNFSIGQEFSFSNASQNITGTLKITGIVPYVDATSKTYLLFAVPVKVHGQLMAGELVIVDLNK